MSTNPSSGPGMTPDDKGRSVLSKGRSAEIRAPGASSTNAKDQEDAFRSLFSGAQAPLGTAPILPDTPVAAAKAPVAPAKAPVKAPAPSRPPVPAPSLPTVEYEIRSPLAALPHSPSLPRLSKDLPRLAKAAKPEKKPSLPAAAVPVAVRRAKPSGLPPPPNRRLPRRERPAPVPAPVLSVGDEMRLFAVELAKIGLMMHAPEPRHHAHPYAGRALRIATYGIAVMFASTFLGSTIAFVQPGAAPDPTALGLPDLPDILGPQLSMVAFSGGGGGGKVDICHIPPGNPDNAHTISVGASAVSAHLEHGDELGECEGDPGEEPDKVVICHETGSGNQTIEVDEHAVEAHLGHGDSLGPCGEGEGHKVTLCHDGKTIEVDEHAVEAHLGHGDSLGPCDGGGDDPPMALFALDCSGLDCSFDASTSFDPDGGAIQAYSWDFGDGSSGFGVQPLHSYADNGTYTIELTVVDDEGDLDSSSQTVTLSRPAPDNIPPSADFVWECVPAGLECTFDGSFSSDADGFITSWEWDFGDGGDASGVLVDHTFAAEGIYSVTLTVQDNHPPPGVGIRTKVVGIVIVINEPPIALLEFDCSGLVCEFDGTVSFDPDGTIVSYDWDLGDGSTATGPKPSHTYAANGTYEVKLTVHDDDGAVDSFKQLIHLVDAVGNNKSPHAEFGYVCTGLNCSFDGSFSSDEDGFITSWTWDFADGSNGTGEFINHTFPAPGIYAVVLTVTDNHPPPGVGSRSRILHLAIGEPGNLPPVAVWSHSCTFLVCKFNASASFDPDGNITNYTWQINPTFYGPTLTYTFPSAGSHFVKLTVRDDRGGLGSAARPITVSGGGGGGGGGGCGNACGPITTSVTVTETEPEPEPESGPGGGEAPDDGPMGPPLPPQAHVQFLNFDAFLNMGVALEASSGRKSHKEGSPHGEDEDQGEESGEDEEAPADPLDA